MFIGNFNLIIDKYLLTNDKYYLILRLEERYRARKPDIQRIIFSNSYKGGFARGKASSLVECKCSLRSEYERENAGMKLKVLGKNSLCAVMEKLCLVLMVLGGGIVIFLPFVLNSYYALVRYPNPDTVRLPMLTVLYVSGVCAFVILLLLRRLLKNVNTENPFTEQNARLLKRIGYLCLPIAAAYFIVMPFLPSVLVLCVALAFTFIAALIAVLAELFVQAVSYKQENDLTI